MGSPGATSGGTRRPTRPDRARPPVPGPRRPGRADRTSVGDMPRSRPRPPLPSPSSTPDAGVDAGAAGAVAGGAGGVRGFRDGPGGAVALVLGGATSLQFGAALAVLLFERAGALGVVALRLAGAAVVLMLVCRPRLRGYRRVDWATVGCFGLALGTMNTLLYQALDRIPVGVAVTLEVLGPLTLSVAASRRWSSLLWAVLALAGVGLLGRDGFDRLDPVGAGFALAAGAMWAAYILLGARTARTFPQADGLALALVVGTGLSLPLGVASAGGALLDPVTLGLGGVVALMSSVLPYTLELLALRRIAAGTFAVLMSLEPAVAAMAGFLVLNQRLGWWDGLAIALVVAASMGAVRTSSR